MKLFYQTLLAIFLFFPAVMAQDLRQDFEAYWKSSKQDLLATYKHLHQNPELFFQEKETSSLLAEKLRKLGYQVTEGIAKTGIAAVLKNGDGPTLLLRTDMDALPVEERTNLPYASSKKAEIKGQQVSVMHACGHDIHMSVWLGTAAILAENRSKWKGTVIFLGQPAEEVGAGAKAMLDDKLYQRIPKPDYALALHVDPFIPTGSVGYVKGAAFANVDSVDITIRGKGGHGAAPHKAIDPVVIAASYVQMLQTIVSRQLSPTEPAVVTVGSIHGGTRYNIIPDEVKLQITVRSYSRESRSQILSSLKKMADAVAEAYSVPKERYPIFEVNSGDAIETPATVNDSSLVDRVVKAWQSFWATERVEQRQAEMIGEDFGRLGDGEPAIPAFMFRLGTTPATELERLKKAGQEPASLHSPLYAPDADGAIPVGIEAMYIAIVEILGKK